MKSKPPDHHRVAAEDYDIVLTLVDSLDAMLAYWDINQVCVFANDAYRDWFGKTREEMIGLTMEELLGPLYQKNLPYILAALGGQKQIFEREIPTPDGKIRHSLATYTPHIVDGEVRGIFVHVADVSMLKNLEQELREAKAKADELATHDYLTGLPNRVLLMDRITQALASAKRNHHMVAVMSFDIDDFKKVNDTLGHGAGDQLLIETASRMKQSLRQADTVARMGGDEFLVVAPEIESFAQVETMADRMLDMARQPFRFEGTTMATTSSLGIALYPRDGTTPEALIAKSDDALYVAKKRGKNRFEFANS
jgi:diguanylate cyclase (GGDEF)-like protein/PAS domain S-box-containing protein